MLKYGSIIGIPAAVISFLIFFFNQLARKIELFGDSPEEKFRFSWNQPLIPILLICVLTGFILALRVARDGPSRPVGKRQELLYVVIALLLVAFLLEFMKCLILIILLVNRFTEISGDSDKFGNNKYKVLALTCLLLATPFILTMLACTLLIIIVSLIYSLNTPCRAGLEETV